MAENMKTVICEQCGFELSIDPENIQSSLPTSVNSVGPQVQKGLESLQAIYMLCHNPGRG